ncbi:myotubularin-related [Anaeramoeba flamelloides]|uniref:Myotubularin-related n=1 Tax=Anaeramoeba flamelloides TaxID=1746091 RepID=A0AAV7ZZX1_9EUKA|nr:myotubularin-related [Anaeramoeba flamelloides]KAJ6229873.1 myotubularin-related [Anaeramoeba flamelloides]
MNRESLEKLFNYYTLKVAKGHRTITEYYLSVNEKCYELLSRDNDLSVLLNKEGSDELCESYPYKIAYPTHIKNYPSFVSSCKNNRLRNRFPVPVVFYKDKYVCRSSTIRNYLKDEEYEKDCKTLKSLSISSIFNFMVEKNRDKEEYKATTESVKKEHYPDLHQFLMPYPGVKFFIQYTRNNYKFDGLLYNFDHPRNEVQLTIPIDFENVKQYHVLPITEITGLYLRTMLRVLANPLQNKHSSIVLHCLSGWDRTPMYITFLRASLWADGVAHQSLSTQEMLYLIVGYDYFLFHHQLKYRLQIEAELFRFTFNFLPKMIGKEFSIFSFEKDSKGPTKEQLKTRERKLLDLREEFFKYYEKNKNLIEVISHNY